MMEPKGDEALKAAKRAIRRAVEGHEIITIRYKELKKDQESPLSSDTELDIFVKNLGIKVKSEEKIECGSVMDSPLGAVQVEELYARIEKLLEFASERTSVRSFDALWCAILQTLEFE